MVDYSSWVDSLSPYLPQPLPLVAWPLLILGFPVLLAGMLMVLFVGMCDRNPVSGRAGLKGLVARLRGVRLLMWVSILAGMALIVGAMACDLMQPQKANPDYVKGQVTFVEYTERVFDVDCLESPFNRRYSLPPTDMPATWVRDGRLESGRIIRKGNRIGLVVERTGGSLLEPQSTADR